MLRHKVSHAARGAIRIFRRLAYSNSVMILAVSVLRRSKVQIPRSLELKIDGDRGRRSLSLVDRGARGSDTRGRALMNWLSANFYLLVQGRVHHVLHLINFINCIPPRGGDIILLNYCAYPPETVFHLLVMDIWCLRVALLYVVSYRVCCMSL